jgi:secreted trypsin-like serine protease
VQSSQSQRSSTSARAGGIRSRLTRFAGVVGVTLAAGFALVAGTSPAYAIAHGVPVSEGMYRFSTKLTMTNIPNPDGTFRNSACSGALVAPQWIITAGHCFHDINGNRVSGPVPYSTTATVGRAILSGTSGYVVNVVEVRQAPRTDVALAKLASPIPSDIAPLPLSSAAPKAGAILRVTGYGATSSVNPVPVTQLQTGQVKIKRVTGSDVMVVGYAPAPDTSACLWDSGAPYFTEGQNGNVALVSVEEDGPACPHSQEETTSRTDRIADWIRQTTA